VTYSLPLFPLHTVLCPGIALPLHIFEPRYRAMIGRCLEEDAPFGVVLIRDGRETGGLAGRIAEVGTAARIRQVGRYADGRMDIVTIGVRRFRVHALDTAREAWLTGIVEDLDDPLGGSAEDAAALADRAGRRFLDYLARVQEGDGRVVLPGSADAPGGQGAGAGAATGLADRDGPDYTGPDDDADDADDDMGAADDDDGDDDDPDGAPADPVRDLAARLIRAAGSGRVGAPPPGSPDTADDLALRRAILLASARRLIAEGDPTAVSWFLTGLIALDLPARQTLLETPDTVARLRRIERHLEREITFLARNLRPLAVDTELLVLRRN